MLTGSLQLTIQGYQRQEVPYEVPYLTFPTKTGRVLVHAPGTGEMPEGRRNRLALLGEELAAKGIASLVSFRPPLPDAENKYPGEPYSYKDASWNRLYCESMAHMVSHALKNAEGICGSKRPELFLSGFSSGGSVCGAVAPMFPVRKVLLFSAYDSVGDYFYAGLHEFRGEVYAVVGEEDLPAVFLASTLETLAPVASAIRSRIVPGCDHGFGGEAGQTAFPKAFLWAFGGDTTFFPKIPPKRA